MGISITLIDILLIYQSNILSWCHICKIERNSVIPIFIYGVPIAATSLSGWIINQSNKMIMNKISGFSNAGIVGVAYGLTLPILMTIFSIITVAVIPRIINMYEERIDVRPLISRFTGYYILASLPLVTVISLYSMDYVQMLASSDKFYIAFKLIPYLAFGTFFLALTDYTTLQYHLAKKTYIDFSVQLTSGIIGIILNIVLIPKLGLVGVGIATLTANFLYFFLSMVIVLPDLNLLIPWRIFARMTISALPFLIIYYIFNRYIHIPALIDMIVLLVAFYVCYWVLAKTILKRPQY